ncbi:MAG: hypothetical protein C4545_07705 [Anaerolineaceae bacterium]|jgi:methionyl-tRNA formyltransferase|nr:MAG: hypothetical protein C4545_07705 [Anaerolineaceae bacterium]
MLRVILFSPIHTSLYSRLVLHGLLQEPQVQVVGVAVRTPWNAQRLRSEFQRDGKRLAQKFIRKYILREKAFEGVNVDNLAKAAQRMQLPPGNLDDLAKEHHIPYQVCRDLSDSICEKFVRPLEPHLIVFTGGGLVRQNILQIPGLGVLNCHTGVLPAYRGMDVVEWTAMENAVEKIGFGVTLHYMDKGVDTGPILLVHHITPAPQDTFSTIRMRLEVEMVQAMLEGVRGIASGNLKARAQKAEDGRQYFVMHPRIKKIAEERLKKQLNDHQMD